MKNTIATTININNTLINIFSVHLHYDPEKKKVQLVNLNNIINNVKTEKTIILGDMNGPYNLDNLPEFTDYSPDGNTFISEINGSRSLDKIISNFPVATQILNPFGPEEENITTNKKHQVTFAGVDRFIKQFFGNPNNDQYICSKNKKHKCSSCYKGLKYDYLDNNDINWFQIPRSLNGRLSDHSFLLATFDNLIIVQLNILAMVKEYCGYFVKSDEAFILSDLRIEQICNVIKNNGPNIVCLQEVDQKSLDIFTNNFPDFTIFHCFHPSRPDGPACFVHNDIEVVKHEIFLI